MDGGGIVEIRTDAIHGNTHYSVRLERSPGYLDLNAADTPRAVLLDKGDHIWYGYVLETASFPANGIVPATTFWFEGETPPEGLAELASNA